MHYPKDIEIWDHAPGRRLVEVVIRLNNENGALAKVSDAINDGELSILTGFFTAQSRSKTATVSFFADITDAEGGLAELKRRLLELDFVESVDAMAAEGGFIVDKQHFPVRWAGRRAVVMRADALNEMLDRLWRIFQSGAVIIIEQMGEAMGRHFAKEIVEDFGPNFATEQLDELLGTYAALGYADVSIERSKSAEFPIVVNARELFECESNAKLGARRRSALFRAHLRGFMSALFNIEFEVTEVQCVGEGDEFCSFKVEPSPRPAARFATVAPDRSRQEAAQSKF